MNIWYIHPYAGSPKFGMSFRPYYMAKNFNLLGNKCTIISSTHHHLSTFSKQDEGKQKVEGVDFYLIPTKSYIGNGINRLINMVGFGLSLFKSSFRAFANEDRPNVIIASTAHPFHFIAANYYAKKYNAKLILEVRDIWPLSLQELVGISKLHPLSLLINIFQKFAYRNCDHCVSLLENAEEYFQSQGLKEGKFTCIPNGIEIESEIKEKSALNIQPRINEIKKSIADFNTVLGYTGAVGIPNNLEPLILAAKKLENYNIAILIVGNGIEKKRLESLCTNKNIVNVFFFDSVPKNLVSEIISMCDAMFINAQPKDIYKYGISPNKIFDYMSLNKPIFNGIEAPENPMAKAGCEILFKGNSSVDLAEKILNFHNDKNKWNIINTEKFVIDNYSYQALSKEYSLLFSKVNL